MMGENRPDQMPANQEKLDEIMDSMAKAAENSNADAKTQSKTQETLGDDMPISPERQEQILRDEETARQVLGLFGLSYDAMIRLDETSPYGQAAMANPGVIKHVLSSENPVIEALKVSLEFMPYAEFISQYGNDPKAIKEAIKAEAMQEAKTQKQKATAHSAEQAATAAKMPFSSMPTGKSDKAPATGDTPTLQEMFKNR